MIRRVIVRAEAEADITEAVIWYHNQQAGLDQEFLAEVQTAINHAWANPRQYPRLRRKPEIRRVITGRFPYRIFFVVRADAIIVFRVLHSARHDREWKKNAPNM